MTTYLTNPKTKGDLLGRILSQDFTGDFRDLAVGGLVDVERLNDHQVKLKFEDGPTFILAIKKPKPLGARIAAKERWERTHRGEGKATTGRYAVPPKTIEESPVGRYGVPPKKPATSGGRKPAPKGGGHHAAHH